MFPKITEEIIESSLQKHVLSLGLEIDSHLTTYQAINVSKEDADLLGCKHGSAMNITNRGFLKTGEVFVVSDIIDINYECTYHTKFNPEALITEIKTTASSGRFLIPFNAVARQMRHKAYEYCRLLNGLRPFVWAVFNRKSCAASRSISTDTCNLMRIGSR